MTQSFVTDSRNDLTIGMDGRLAIASGLQAVLFACEAIVEAMLGEMPYAIDEGMPNFQVIWNGSPNAAQFEAAARTQWLAIDGVQGVPEFSATLSSGALTYTATIQTIFGVGAING